MREPAQVARVRDLPEVIMCSNGRELQGEVLNRRAHERGLTLQFVEPDKPVRFSGVLLPG